MRVALKAFLDASVPGKDLLRNMDCVATSIKNEGPGLGLVVVTPITVSSFSIALHKIKENDVKEWDR